MTTGIKLDPQAVFDDGALYSALGLSATTLANARREGQLRFVRKGKRVLYLGKWLIDWLDTAKGEGVCHAG
jgi:hypothetical protein